MSLPIDWHELSNANSRIEPADRQRINSPYGLVEISVSEGLLTALDFPGKSEGFPSGTIEPNDWEMEVLRHVSKRRVLVMGPAFQIKVWKQLVRIPVGQTRCYGEIAATAGYPKAARAVGTAIGRNPLSVIIPCHRVIRRDGSLGGYHWGLPIKEALLRNEGSLGK